MSLNIVEQLLKAKPKQRSKLLLAQRDKNIAFFKKTYPQLAEFIEKQGTGRYHINITPDFLEVSDRKTGQLCHFPGKLLETTSKLGAPHHNHWIDKLAVTQQLIPGVEHCDKVLLFFTKMHEKLPVIQTRVASGIISLPRLADGRRYSGATVFLGVHVGLHVLHYLNHTEVRDLIIIEPDTDNFALSCFFIDYAAIQQYRRLILHVGPELPDTQVGNLINESPVTVTAWLRILPLPVPGEHFAIILQRFHLQWRGLVEIFVPFDRELRNVCYGMRNLKAKLPINNEPPTLSENSRIVVVASGPSLQTHLDWLRQHQDRLIIMCTHSAVSVLKKHGIRPDFQCSLDTEIEDDLLDKLDLDYDVPYVSYFKADPKILARFKTVLLINEMFKANPVAFARPIAGITHPTSGNTATAAAVFAQPKQLFFIGLDLGFRDPHREHVQGYWLGEADNVAASQQIMLAVANFESSQGQIYTMSYYDSARFGIQNALTKLGEGCKVFNLSDGAKIVGADPLHAEDCELSDYPEKNQDLAAFHAAFTTESEGVWQFYKTPGKAILTTLRETFVEIMTLKRFEWLTFSRALDKMWHVAVQRCLEREPQDFRVEIYGKLIHDLLAAWYRVMIFTKTPQETEKAYQWGLTTIEEILASLTWPEELDKTDDFTSTPES